MRKYSIILSLLFVVCLSVTSFAYSKIVFDDDEINIGSVDNSSDGSTDTGNKENKGNKGNNGNHYGWIKDIPSDGKFGHKGYTVFGETWTGNSMNLFREWLKDVCNRNSVDFREFVITHDENNGNHNGWFD